MNVVFLIGNGFDLNCGLKTSYYDVYQEYCKIQSDDACIQKFKNLIADHPVLWGDFEIAMSQNINKFDSEEEFLKCLRDFKKFLNTYLVQEMERFDSNLEKGGKELGNRISQELSRSLRTFYTGITHDLSNRISSALGLSYSTSFISFNYTDTFDKLIWYGSNKEVIHIHGKLNDDLVLGMDNETQLGSEAFPLSYRLKRAFIKPAFNATYDTERVKNATAAIAKAELICAFGMSLGESDLCWRNAILKAMVSANHPDVFIYRHELSGITGMTIDERMDLEDDEKRKLLNDWGLKDEDMAPYMEKLHLPCGKSIFDFKDIIGNA